jgi:hypothetical protein
MSSFSTVGLSGGDSGVEIASIFDKIASSLGANDPNTYAFAAVCFSQASLTILWSLSWTLLKYLLYIGIFLTSIPAYFLFMLVLFMDMCICIMLMIPFSVSSLHFFHLLKFNPILAYQNYIVIPRDLLWDDFLLLVFSFLGIPWPSIQMVSFLIFFAFERSCLSVLNNNMRLMRLPVLEDFRVILMVLTCTILVVSCTMVVMDLFATY